MIASVSRLSTEILLRPDDVPASREDFIVVGAFNPGVARTADGVMLLVRVAERPRDIREGFFGLPRWERDELVVDWVSAEEWQPIDSRVVRRNADGLVRLTFTSHLRVVRCGEGRGVQEITSIAFRPQGALEEFGVEDPRITLLNGRYYITYVAVSRHGPATMLASTTDFRTLERHGVIYCPENKAVVLFPDRIDGQYVALHRPVCGTLFTRPEMWIARSPDLLHWGAHTPLVIRGGEWQSGRVGAGPPPIRLSEGWLTIYHGNRHTTQPGDVGTYYGGALLLNGNDPSRVLKQTVLPFFRPEADFEVNGFVPNVVFPTGAVRDGDRLFLYYGAADAVTAVAEFSIPDLLGAMTAPG